MARHYKNGLEYFSHDTTMKYDTKIKLLKAKFGIYGYGVYNLILEEVDELWDCIKSNDQNINKYNETIQIIAMCVCYIQEVLRK